MDDLHTNAEWLWWLQLTGGVGADFAQVAAREVLGDAEPLIALNLPAAEFVEWFKFQSWKDFEQYEATGDDEWAFTSLMNAKAARYKLGAMASQRATAFD